MEILKVKIRDKKTGAIKMVKKSLADDYIGTKKFELVLETPTKRDESQKEKPHFRATFLRKGNKTEQNRDKSK